MAQLWIFLSFLNVIFCAADFNRSSFISVKPGERLTLNCTIEAQSSKILTVWYKQQFGELPVEVGIFRAQETTQTPPTSSRFKVEENKNGISLTILQTKKSDEGLYFCGIYTWAKFQFFNGAFVAVTDKPDLSVSVFQSSVRDSVSAGTSVTLQCSVLSESKMEKPKVFWFRAAPPESHPQIIYTHHNSSRQCERVTSTHTCVYNFSKNIFSLNDTGTYYCAVALCGKIVLGNGTLVQMEEFNSVVICLATALAVCVVVIFTQVILNCRKQKRAKPAQGSLRERTRHQVRDAVGLNYAALNLNERKSNGARTKKRHQDTLYSEVTLRHVT